MSLIKNYIIRLYGSYLRRHFRILYEKNPKLAAYGLYDRIYDNHDNFNLDDPHSLIEKITWMELNTDTSLWTLCADKYRMREYVAKCGLEMYLPKLYGHWDNPDDIDFNQLPNEFVLKANNGCGTVKIIKDKSAIKWKKLKKELKRWLKYKFGYMGAQTHYLSIKPCILAEELLHQDEKQNAISPESMVDYKVWCINGEPESIWVAYNRCSTHVNMDLYDLEWNSIPQHLISSKHYIYNPTMVIPKPKCLSEMLDISRKLAKPFPEVRVDLYVVDNKPIIGELTFSTGYGYFTNDYYRYLGDKIILPIAK